MATLDASLSEDRSALLRRTQLSNFTKRLAQTTSSLRGVAGRIQNISPKAVAKSVFSWNTLTSVGVGSGVRAAMGATLSASGGAVFAAGAAATTSSIMSVIGEANKRTEFNARQRGYWADLGRTSISSDFYNTLSSQEFLRSTAVKAGVSAGVASGVSIGLALIPDSVSQAAVDKVSAGLSKIAPIAERVWNALPSINLVSAAHAAPGGAGLHADFPRLNSNNAAYYGFERNGIPLDQRIATSFGFYQTEAYKSLTGAQQVAADALVEASLDNVEQVGGYYKNTGIARAHIFATTPAILDELVAYSDELKATYPEGEVDYGAIQDSVKLAAVAAADAHKAALSVSNGVWDLLDVNRAMAAAMVVPNVVSDIQVADVAVNDDVVIAQSDIAAEEPIAEVVVKPVVVAEAVVDETIKQEPAPAPIVTAEMAVMTLAAADAGGITNTPVTATTLARLPLSMDALIEATALWLGQAEQTIPSSDIVVTELPAAVLVADASETGADVVVSDATTGVVSADDYTTIEGARDAVRTALGKWADVPFDVTDDEKIAFTTNPAIIDPIATYGLSLAEAGEAPAFVSERVAAVVEATGEAFVRVPDVQAHVDAVTAALEGAVDNSEEVQLAHSADVNDANNADIINVSAFADIESAQREVTTLLMGATQETSMVTLAEREAFAGDPEIIAPIAQYGVNLAADGAGGDALSEKITVIVRAAEGVFEKNPDISAHIAAVDGALKDQGFDYAAFVAEADSDGVQLAEVAVEDRTPLMVADVSDPVKVTLAAVEPVDVPSEVATVVTVVDTTIVEGAVGGPSLLESIQGGDIPGFEDVAEQPDIIMAVAGDDRAQIFAEMIPERKSGIMQVMLENLKSNDPHVVAQAVKDLSHGAFNGEYGMSVDREAAFSLNDMALGIDPDNGQALFNKGYALLHGKGTDVDLDSAHAMFERAVDAGYDRAEDQLDYMERVLRHNPPAPAVG